MWCQNIYLLKQTNQLIGQDLLPRLGSAHPALKPDQSYFQTDLLPPVKIFQTKLTAVVYCITRVPSERKRHVALFIILFLRPAFCVNSTGECVGRHPRESIPGFYLTLFMLQLVFLFIQTDQSNKLCIQGATWGSQRILGSIINVYCSALLKEVQMYHFNFRN